MRALRRSLHGAALAVLGALLAGAAPAESFQAFLSGHPELELPYVAPPPPAGLFEREAAPAPGDGLRQYVREPLASRRLLVDLSQSDPGDPPSVRGERASGGDEFGTLTVEGWATFRSRVLVLVVARYEYASPEMPRAREARYLLALARSGVAIDAIELSVTGWSHWAYFAGARDEPGPQPPDESGQTTQPVRVGKDGVIRIGERVATITVGGGKPTRRVSAPTRTVRLHASGVFCPELNPAADEAQVYEDPRSHEVLALVEPCPGRHAVSYRAKPGKPAQWLTVSAWRGNEVTVEFDGSDKQYGLTIAAERITCVNPDQSVQTFARRAPSAGQPPPPRTGGVSGRVNR